MPEYQRRSTRCRADIDSAKAVSLRPLLETAVRAGEVVPLPDDYPREVSLQAAQDGDLLMFRIFTPSDTPLASATAARSEPVSELAWPTVDALGAAPTLPDRPPAPWCAMYLPISMIGGADPEDRAWLADLAQHLAWCWAKLWTIPRNFRSPV